VEKIAKKYLRRPAIVTIGNVGEAVETVEQRVEFVSGEDKRKKRLNEILASGEFQPPIIVFVNIKRNCDAVARDIKHMGFSSVTLHGSKTQEQREAALASVRSGTTNVLVATDLAGRGIDVPDVSLVVNFNMATNIESYTHRIGTYSPFLQVSMTKANTYLRSYWSCRQKRCCHHFLGQRGFGCYV
jgi:ATP-dependent RNA helicase DDX23/PRP28